MANLIIKPSAGGDLVIKSSDDSPAITVGTTGQTTFAEPATMSGTLGVTGNTTLSGTANVLGTISSMTPPSGYSINHVAEDYSTRAAIPLQNQYTFWSFDYNKTTASSKLIVSCLIPLYDDHAGALGFGFKYNTTEVWCGLYTYVEENAGHIGMIHGVLEGHTTTGSQTLLFQFKNQNGGTTDKVAQVFCPNTTDDSRMFQTISTAHVYELLT